MKFHINPKTANPGQCRAAHSCPFGGDEEHFDSKAEAQQEIERRLSSSVVPAVAKKTSPDESLTSIKQRERELGSAERQLKDDMAAIDKVFLSSRTLLSGLSTVDFVAAEDATTLKAALSKVTTEAKMSHGALRTKLQEVQVEREAVNRKIADLTPQLTPSTTAASYSGGKGSRGGKYGGKY